MVLKSLDLLVVMVIVAAALLLHGLGVTGGPLVVVFGTLLALVLPGYALSAAMFGPRPILSAERAALSLGISLSVIILGGLVLDALPGGLDPQSWLLLLGGVTVAAASFALLRRTLTETPTEAELPEAESEFAATPKAQQRLSPTRAQVVKVVGVIQHTPLRPLLLSGLAVVVLAAGIAVAVTGAQRQQASAAVTQLWMLPDQTTRSKLDLGIHTEAEQPMEYRLALLINGTLYESWDPIHLGSTQTWETSVTIPSPPVADVVRVEVDLYRTDQPATIFRHVSVVLSGSTGTLPSSP